METEQKSKSSILIVEDDVLIAESNKYLLKRAGYDIAGIAMNGEQAIKTVQEKVPSLILMDINLGKGIDGITAAEEIQKFADVPIIFLTAYADPATTERAKKVGPFGYLIKPCDNKELLVVIETSIHKHLLDKKVKEQELLFRTVANFAYEWEFWLTPDMQFKFCSPSCERITGYKAEEFTEKPELYVDIVHPDDKEKVNNFIVEYSSPEKYDETVKDFQYRIVAKDESIKFISHTCTSIFDDKHNYLGRRITIIDITQRKKAEEDIKHANFNFQLAVEGGDLGVFTVHHSTDKLEFNERFLSMVGYIPNELTSTKNFWHSLIHPEDLPIFLEHVDKFRAGEINEMDIQYRVKHKDGNWIWIQEKVKGFDYDSEGKPAKAAGIHQDITQIKLAEEALGLSEKRNRAITEMANDSIISVNSDGKVIAWNRASEKIFGFTAEEMIGNSFEDIIPEKYLKLHQIGFERLKNGGQPKLLNSTVQIEGKRRTEEIFPIEISLSEWESDNQKFFTAIIRDITERKQAEEELRSSEEKYRLLFEQSPIGIGIGDLQGNIIEANPINKKITGYDFDVEKDVNISDLYINQEDRQAILKKLKAGGSVKNFELKLKRKGGEIYDGSISAAILRYGNKDLTFIHIEDITERKKAEAALSESEEKFRKIFEDHSAIKFIIEPETGYIIDANKAATDFYGWTLEELRARMIQQIDVSPEESRDRMSVLVKFKRFQFETKHHLKNGEIKDVEVYTSVIELSGKPFIHSIIHDITEKKKTEKALLESEEKFRNLFENHAATELIIDPETGNIIDVNKSACEFYGWTYEELKQMKIYQLNVLPENQVIELMKEVEEKKKNHFVARHRIKDGTIRDVEVFSSRIEIGGKIYLHSINHDITESRIAEEELRRFFSLVPVMVAVTGNGKFVRVNDEWQKVLGYAKEEMIGQAFADFIHPDDIESTRKESAKLMSGIDSNNFINRYRAKNGEYKIFEWNIVASPDGTHFYGAARDITERKKIEEELHSSFNRYRKLVDNSPIPTTITGVEKRKFLYLNQSAIDLFGVSTEGKSIYDINPNDFYVEAAEGENKFKTLLEKGRIAKMETKLKTLNGKEISVIISSVLTVYEGESAIFSSLYDITDRKKAEEELIESEEKFRSIFEDHSAVKILLDTDNGNFIDANKAACKFYGYTRDELKQMNISQVNMLTPDEIQNTIGEIVSNKRRHIESKHKLKNGEIRDVEAYASPVHFGNKVCNYAIVLDVTEKKKNELELQNYRNHLEELVESRTEELSALNRDLNEQVNKQKELELMLRSLLNKEKELNELKTRFVSTASHEFRTPLTTVLSSAEMIQRYGKKWTDEKYDEHLNKIKSSVDYLTKLLDDVLTVNRTGKDEHSFKLKSVDLYKLCLDIIEQTKSYQTDKHKLNFDFSIEKKEYHLDEKLIRFILTNLLTNAFKYSPRGGQIEFIVSEKDNNIQFEISDKGMGIPASDINNIFEPFHRAYNAAEIPGTGLGLSIVKQSVELHNGKINLQSKVGKGTTFKVEIPIS